MGCGIDRQAEKLADVTDNLTDQCIEKPTASENSNSLQTFGFLSPEQDQLLYGDIICLSLESKCYLPTSLTDFSMVHPFKLRWACSLTKTKYPTVFSAMQALATWSKNER